MYLVNLSWQLRESRAPHQRRRSYFCSPHCRSRPRLPGLRQVGSPRALADRGPASTMSVALGLNCPNRRAIPPPQRVLQRLAGCSSRRVAPRRILRRLLSRGSMRARTCAGVVSRAQGPTGPLAALAAGRLRDTGRMLDAGEMLDAARMLCNQWAAILQDPALMLTTSAEGRSAQRVHHKDP